MLKLIGGEGGMGIWMMTLLSLLSSSFSVRMLFDPIPDGDDYDYCEDHVV